MAQGMERMIMESSVGDGLQKVLRGIPGVAKLEVYGIKKTRRGES